MKAIFITCVLIFVVWQPLLSTLADNRFSLHMLLHLVIVCLLAPWAAIRIRRALLYWLHPQTPIAVLWMSLADFVVIWGWHTPALHQAAVHSLLVFTLEQTSYLFVGTGLWVSVLGNRHCRIQLAAGIAGLLFTSMHMSLLGVLLAVANQPLYGHWAEHVLQDQQSGGVLMLAVGGVVYLVAALIMLTHLLKGPVASQDDATGFDSDPV